jgi:hypothetical protein
MINQKISGSEFFEKKERRGEVLMMNFLRIPLTIPIGRIYRIQKQGKEDIINLKIKKPVRRLSMIRGNPENQDIEDMIIIIDQIPILQGKTINILIKMETQYLIIVKNLIFTIPIILLLG